MWKQSVQGVAQCDLLMAKLYHYTSDDMDKTYRYLFRVHGTLPKAASSSTYDVLANEKYSFNEIAKSMYSNNSEDIVDFEFAHF